MFTSTAVVYAMFEKRSATSCAMRTHCYVDGARHVQETGPRSLSPSRTVTQTDSRGLSKMKGSFLVSSQSILKRLSRNHYYLVIWQQPFFKFDPLALTGRSTG